MYLWIVMKSAGRRGGCSKWPGQPRQSPSDQSWSLCAARRVPRCLPTAAATCQRQTRPGCTHLPSMTAPDHGPWRHLKVIIASLKVICWRTGSQWSWRSTRVMWSNFLVPVTSRAAAFWTVCSFVRRPSPIPVQQIYGVLLYQWIFCVWADNSGSCAAEVRRFVDEAVRMKEFDHPNVLSLIGVALDFDNLPLVVLPFMRHGDLLSYIRNEAHVSCPRSLWAALLWGRPS